jgi:L-alanine-DL-glutamate epimerase-like enolase superfamily enzyme
MRITRAESLHADGGWRPFSFLKLSTDEGLVGWSEYSRGPWAPKLEAIIQAMAETLRGRDPRAFALLSAELHAAARFAPAGLNHQAIAAIENACIDLAAKSAGVPVHRLFGGPLRESQALYWSHCGSFRVSHPECFARVLKLPPLSSLDDMKRLGAEVGVRGFSAAKINPINFHGEKPILLNPGFIPAGLDHARRLSPAITAAIEDQVAAFIEGLNGKAELMLDVNFGFSAESVIRLARRLRSFELKWLECDIHDAQRLSAVRSASRMPIASLETLYGRRGYAPYLESRAVDIVIIDVPWNGFAEAVRIANSAERHELNVAPHNFYGPLADLMAAQFGACVPNFEIMEIELDDVPWKYNLLTQAPVIENGSFRLPTGLGWGADVNEDMLANHPWPQ